MKTMLSRANKLVQDGRYDEAIALYEIIQKAENQLVEIAKFNILLANSRKRRASISIRAGRDACADTRNAVRPLQKPDCIDQNTFDQIKKSGLFDPDWYIVKYDKLLNPGGNPLAHYLEDGLAMGLNPSPRFDTEHYLKSNPDVAEAGVHPFLHFIFNGKAEGRAPLGHSEEDYSRIYPVSKPKYVPRVALRGPLAQRSARLIAFYLPQFHPIPENDAWWGEGFTEWTNVRPAEPQFHGHYQPHVPDPCLGYYNLLDREIQRKQIELATQYGIEGFCFYVYWFNGRRLLEKPLDNFVADRSQDFPFCVCWANENWTRRWDGLDEDILMRQDYSESDDIQFIEASAKYLRDTRYIRIDGRPLLLVYRPSLFPDMVATARRWRSWCKANGVGDLYLAYPQAFDNADPSDYGFDAAIEFPPNRSSPPNITEQTQGLQKDFEGAIYDWRVLVERSQSYTQADYVLFRSLNPGWDNTARKKRRASILKNSCPELFEQWAFNAFLETQKTMPTPEERLVFVNAWNEWAEGAHLEPDLKYGFAWLQAIRNAHEQTLKASNLRIGYVIHAFYLDVLEEIAEKIKWAKGFVSKVYVSVPEGMQEKARVILSGLQVDVEIFEVQNHGRDVYPFLLTLPKLRRDNIDYIVKLHTKKSLHRTDGDQWRHELYEQLLSKAFLLFSIRTVLLNPNAVLVAPDNSVVPLNYYWGSNKDRVAELVTRAGLQLSNPKALTFITGTMFFACTKYVDEISALKLSKEDFEPERGQLDGTLAHALERFIGIPAQLRGQVIATPNFQKCRPFSYAEAMPPNDTISLEDR